MGRKKKNNAKNKILQVLIIFLIILTGIYYIWLNCVPQKWYETQMMRAQQPESYYINQWCTSDFGRKEVVLWDMSRVDCLAKDYAIEFDFANKWAESIGKSLYYAKLTNKEAAIVLILNSPADYSYVKRAERLDNGIKIFLIKAY